MWIISADPEEEAQQGRSVDNPVVIISTFYGAGHQPNQCYRVQLLDGMTDWEKERILSRYSMNIANMEIFYPQEGHPSGIYDDLVAPGGKFNVCPARNLSADGWPKDHPGGEPVPTLAVRDGAQDDGESAPTFRRVGQSCCWTMRGKRHILEHPYRLNS